MSRAISGTPREGAVNWAAVREAAKREPLAGIEELYHAERLRGELLDTRQRLRIEFEGVEAEERRNSSRAPAALVLGLLLLAGAWLLSWIPTT